MGSSAKKKKEKKKDFQKPKLKVGKTRPKNTNATDTSFTAKSVVFKQQNLGGTERDAVSLFHHNLSLLSSKTDVQRRDALTYLTTVASTEKYLPQPPSVILAKAQALVLDGSLQVRQQLLKLLRCLPVDQFGSWDQLLLYTRAGMNHLSNDIRMSALDVLDWMLEANATAVVSCAGGWVTTLRTFQKLLSWHDATTANGARGWSNSKPAPSNLGSNKLLVHQLTTLSHLLTAGLNKPSQELERAEAAQRAADLFPIWHMDAHMISEKSNPFGYLNLFGPARDVESEMYEAPEERADIFCNLGLKLASLHGVKEAKQQAGEVGRAASSIEKALKLAGEG